MVIRYFYIFFVVSKSGFLFIFSNEFRVDFLVRLKLARQFDTYVALSVAVYAVFLDNKI